MKFLWCTVQILLFITITIQSPHVFEERETCEVLTKIGKKTVRYVVPAQINAENEDIRVSVILCTKDEYVRGGQTTKPKISVYDKASSIKQENKDTEPYNILEDRENIIITSITDIKCSESLNYTVTIKLGHLYSKKPRLNIESECEIEIGITNPDYDPPCRKFIDGKWFIDLTPLKRKTFTVNNDKGDTFHISLCGPASGYEQVGYKISSNETTILGSLKNQKVNYNFGTNTVTVTSFIKEGRKKTMLVTLKCNWNVPYISNPKLINEGTNYKFEVESSFGCVKLPKDCVIKDKNLHLTYDLRGLLKKDGSIVSKTSTPIRLNICGDLQMRGVKNNNCHKEKSQVCEMNGKTYLNKGSIPFFDVSGDKLRAHFRNGDKCNVNETYSTIVDFKCSSRETGPVYINQHGCTTNISWETPKACPTFQMETKSCSFHSSYGSVDLSGFHSTDGITEPLSRNRRLIYNICGNLNFNCSESDQVSACLIEGNRQKIIGWNEPNLSFINGKLQLVYKGTKCLTKDQPYLLTINMMCSFVKEQIKPVLKEVDDCTFEVTVFSSTACLKPWEIKNCMTEEENYKYDLSPLIRRDINYEIKDDKERDRTYFLNLCAPVIPKENLLFHPKSMMIMQDPSKELITERFPTLGQVTDPIIQDGKLLVKLTGSMCEPGVMYSNKIYFECSNHEEQPTILTNNGCSMEFRWRSRHACPIMKKGGRCSISDGNDSIEVPGDPIEVKMDNFNIYYFSLCVDYYRWCTANNSCATRKLSKRIQKRDGIFYLQLSLDNTDGSLLRTANLMVDCDPYTFLNSSKGQISNPVHLDLNVKTRISCDKASGKFYRDAEQIEPDKKHEYKTEAEGDDHNTSVVNFEKNIPKEEQQVHSTLKKVEEEVSHRTEATSKQTSNEVKEYHQNETARKEKPKKIKDSETSHSSDEIPVNNEIKPADVIQTTTNKRCDIINVKGKTLELKDLVSKEFKSNATYILNFDGKSSKCGGLLCKNGGNLLNFIEDCPDISYGEDHVDLNYRKFESGYINAANSSVIHVGKSVEVFLRCSNNEITLNVSETSSKTIVNYYSPKICIFSETSNTFVYIYVILGLLVLLILCLISFVFYRKDYCKKCSYDRVSEEGSLIIHSKLL